MTVRSMLTLALATLGMSGCSSPMIANDPFGATGETIAFSGGAAGPTGACSTCHGVAGQGDGDRAPRIAGLDRGYALRQLENFASGARRHPQMQWIAGRLDSDAREKVTTYYAGLTWGSAASSAAGCSGATIYHEGVPARGIASCSSCHGANGLGNAGNPPLAGQPAPYLAHQLAAWASGERYGDANGTMTAISRALHPRYRQAVAAYAASLADDGDDRSVRATCPRTRRPDRPDGA